MDEREGLEASKTTEYQDNSSKGDPERSRVEVSEEKGVASETS